MTNHLGNVLAVVSDRKLAKAVSGTAIQWFEADVLSSQQYYAFGMLMPGRQYSAAGYDYRFGFNGKEVDDEIKGDDNRQDGVYPDERGGMRIYDPRVGRFLSVDPIAGEYPELTPYQFAGNMPVWAVDLDGLEPSAAAQYRTNSDGLVILVSPAVDNARVENHPAYRPQIKPQPKPVAPSNPASINVPQAEKERQILAKYNADVLRVVVADPQKLAEGDFLEWASILPFGKVAKLAKVGKWINYSEDVAKLVDKTGLIEEGSKEIITVLKEGSRTFGNAKKVAEDIVGNLGDDAIPFVSTVGEGKNPLYNKVVGWSSKDGKRYWRVDWDELKGAHVNWQVGKDKGAIPIEGGLEQVKRIVDNEVLIK